MKLLHRVMSGIAIGVCACSAVVAAPQFRITDLGALSPGDVVFPSALNNQGQVVGSYTSGQTSQPFIWSAAGGFQSLGPVMAPDTGFGGVDINDAGQVAITSSGNWGGTGWRWSAAEGLLPMPSLGGSRLRVLGIDGAGNLVGAASDAGGVDRPLIWFPGSAPTLLPVVGSTYWNVGARAISGAGLVIGGHYPSTGERQAFTWTSTTGVVDLPVIPARFGPIEANDVTEQGLIVGSSGGIAVRWWQGEVHSLGTLPRYSYSSAAAANESGWIVGTASGAYGFEPDRPVLWTEADGLMSLPALIDPADPLLPLVTLDSAVDINELGQILVRASLSGAMRAVLLTPVPELPTLPMFAAGLLLVGVAARRTRRENT